jgi:hypothetical protein
MNKLLPAFVLLAGIAQRQKPAIRNERTCSQAHAYLMERG